MIVMDDNGFVKCNRCCLCDKHENLNFILYFIIFISHLLATIHNNDGGGDDDDYDKSFRIDIKLYYVSFIIAIIFKNAIKRGKKNYLYHYKKFIINLILQKSNILF